MEHMYGCNTWFVYVFISNTLAATYLKRGFFMTQNLSKASFCEIMIFVFLNGCGCFLSADKYQQFNNS